MKQEISILMIVSWEVEKKQGRGAGRKQKRAERGVRRKQKRGVRKDVFNQLMQGKFTPTRPSDFFIKRLAEINRDLNKLEGTQVRSPYFEALPEINKIILDNRNLSLKDDNVKFFEDVEPVAQQETSIQTPFLPQTGAPIVSNTQTANVVNPLSGLTQTETALLSPEEQIIRQRIKRT